MAAGAREGGAAHNARCGVTAEAVAGVRLHRRRASRARAAAGCRALALFVGAVIRTVVLVLALISSSTFNLFAKDVKCVVH